MLLKACHEILVLEVIGDSCSQQRVGTVRQRVGTVRQRVGTVRQRVGTVRQRVGSVHYQFKLPLEMFIWV